MWNAEQTFGQLLDWGRLEQIIVGQGHFPSMQKVTLDIYGGGTPSFEKSFQSFILTKWNRMKARSLLHLICW